MSCHASEGYLKQPINKKFFIQKLILIFVPLQKIHPRKTSEKELLKRFLTSLKLLLFVMPKTFEKVWANCLEIIKDIVEWQHYKTWFEPIHRLS